MSRLALSPLRRKHNLPRAGGRSQNIVEITVSTYQYVIPHSLKYHAFVVPWIYLFQTYFLSQIDLVCIQARFSSYNSLQQKSIKYVSGFENFHDKETDFSMREPLKSCDCWPKPFRRPCAAPPPVQLQAKNSSTIEGGVNFPGVILKISCS